MKRTSCALVLVCCALLAPLAARAQEPSYEDEDGLRVSLGAGLNHIAGADTELNDDEIGDPPTSYAPIPTPVGVLRIDLPVHERWLVGVQASGFAWDTTFEQQLGYGNHLTIDVSALARMRLSFDQYRRSELVVSLALGPSVDSVEPSPRSTGEDIDGNVGFHLGAFASYQLKPRSFPLGVFVDVGFMAHWLSQTSAFSTGGRDEIAYFPLQAFVRVGAMFLIR